MTELKSCETWSFGNEKFIKEIESIQKGESNEISNEWYNAITLAFQSKKTNNKKWLTEYDTDPKITFGDFTSEELIHFSKYYKESSDSLCFSTYENKQISNDDILDNDEFIIVI
jgi:hypothetical protein